MKNPLFSLLAVIIAINSYSQTPGISEKGIFKFGLHYSYDKNLSSDQISFDEYSGYIVDYNHSNYSTGLSLGYSISSNLILGSGINYSQKSFTGIFYCDVCDFSSPPLPEKIELQFIEIPVTAKYYILRSGFNVYGEGGIGNLWRINGENDFEGKNYLLSAKLGGGIEYAFLDRYWLQLSADYSHGLTGVFQDADYAYRILGIKLGFLIDL